MRIVKCIGILLFIIFIFALLLIGCSKKSSTGPINNNNNNDTTGTGGIVVYGMIINSYDTDSSYANIFFKLGTNFVTDASVKINGIDIPFDSSYSSNSYSKSLYINAGTLCTLKVTRGTSVNFKRIAKMPDTFNITSPVNNANIQANTNLIINWTLSQYADGYIYYIDNQSDSANGFIENGNILTATIPGQYIIYNGNTSVGIISYNGALDFRNTPSDSLEMVPGFGCIYIPNSVNVRVSGGQEQVDTTVIRAGNLRIDVSSGTRPHITWTPTLSLVDLVIFKNDGTTGIIWYVTGEINSPVDYGVMQSGFVQVIPSTGTPPDLIPGMSYEIAVEDENGDGSYIIFTR